MGTGMIVFYILSPSAPPNRCYFYLSVMVHWQSFNNWRCISSRQYVINKFTSGGWFDTSFPTVFCIPATVTHTNVVNIGAVLFTVIHLRHVFFLSFVVPIIYIFHLCSHSFVFSFVLHHYIYGALSRADILLHRNFFFFLIITLTGGLHHCFTKLPLLCVLAAVELSPLRRRRRSYPSHYVLYNTCYRRLLFTPQKQYSRDIMFYSVLGAGYHICSPVNPSVPSKYPGESLAD